MDVLIFAGGFLNEFIQIVSG